MAAVYDQLSSTGDAKTNDRRRRNFVFHMTDWAADLDRLTELYRHPEKFDRATAAELVSGFLLHVIPHLQAAGRLALDYTPEDIFQDLDDTSG